MPPKSPNDELADKVIQALVQKKLIQDRRKEEVRSALTSGRARPEDWRVWAEDYTREEAKDGGEDATGKPHA